MNVKVFLADRTLIEKTLKEDVAVIYDSHILSVVHASELGKALEDLGINREDKGLVEIQKIDGILSPGFVDVHVHGSAGADIMDGSIESIDALSKALSAHGVTSYLGATVSSDRDSVIKAADSIRSVMQSSRLRDKEPIGARVLGMHLEGPFLSPERAGAHDPKFLSKPEPEYLEGMTDVIRLITFAPELDEDKSFISWIKTKAPHIKLSMGHSNATFDQAMDAIESGVDSTTHLFNAMSGLHHREPGVVGAVLSSDIYAEVIADGVHVHEGALRAAYRAKGDDQIILITDAMCAACMRPGTYKLGGLNVTTDGESARLDDGTLAGSVLTLETAVKHMHETIGAPLGSALYMASAVPAEMIEETDAGRIEQGYRSDFVLLDHTLEVVQTVVGGEIVFGGSLCES